jgi:hypothetical protein
VKLLFNFCSCSKSSPYSKYRKVLDKTDEDIERSLDLFEFIRRTRMFSMRMAFTKSKKKELCATLAAKRIISEIPDKFEFESKSDMWRMQNVTNQEKRMIGMVRYAIMLSDKKEKEQIFKRIN